MGSLKLTTASSGSVILSPANTASDVTITVPASTATMAINGPAFSAYQSSGQSITANTSTKLTFTTEEFDTASCYDTANSRFTPNVAGYYQINAAIEASAFASSYFVIQVKKNGSSYRLGSNYPTNAGAGPVAIATTLVYMNGSTDYLEIFAQASANFSTVTGTGANFQAFLARAA